MGITLSNSLLCCSGQDKSKQEFLIICCGNYIPADIAPLVSFDAHWGSLNKAQVGWFLKKKKKKKKIKSTVWSPGWLAGFLKKKFEEYCLKPRLAGF